MGKAGAQERKTPFVKTKATCVLLLTRPWYTDMVGLLKHDQLRTRTKFGAKREKLTRGKDRDMEDHNHNGPWYVGLLGKMSWW